MRRRMLRVLAAVATALIVSACAAGNDPTASSAPQVQPAAGSNLQDMLDLYALKRQLAAIRREQPTVSGNPECGG